MLREAKKQLDECILCCTPADRSRIASRFQALGVFRTRVDGQVYPQFTGDLHGLKKMTCHELQSAIMLYPYALGSRCGILPAVLRRPALAVMRLAQTTLIAMGNQRPLTQAEAHMVFFVGGRALYRCMSEIHRKATLFHIERTRGRNKLKPHDADAKDPLQSEDTVATADDEDNPRVTRHTNPP